MKTGLLSALLLIITIATVSFSGCLTVPGLSGDSAQTGDGPEGMSEVLELYGTDIFIPTIKGEQKVVSSGSYTVLSKSEVQVLRLVNDTKDIPILKETSLLAFSEGEIKDVYFLTADSFSMTVEGVDALETNPILMNLNYSVKHTNQKSVISLDQNFSGLLVYTYIPKSDSNRIVINDGADAVRITLPVGMNTGNRILGTASPTPDTVETLENGEKMMTWNAPVGAVAVKYYSENAPFYMLISFSALAGAIIAVFLWNRYQIRRLHRITEFTDSDAEEGFRKPKN